MVTYRSTVNRAPAMDTVWLVIYAAVAIVIWEAQAVTLYCPPGHALNSSRNGCAECGNDQYMDKFNNEQSCLECTVCTGLKMMVSKCNASANTVCKCPPNHNEHVDGCTPIVGATIADNCSLLLDNIEKSVDALRQSLNGTAEKALLESVVNELRMVKSNLASVDREADRFSSTQDETVTKIISELTTVRGLQISVLVIFVVINLIWTAKVYFFELKKRKPTSVTRPDEQSIRPLLTRAATDETNGMQLLFTEIKETVLGKPAAEGGLPVNGMKQFLEDWEKNGMQLLLPKITETVLGKPAAQGGLPVNGMKQFLEDWHNKESTQPVQAMETSIGDHQKGAAIGSGESGMASLQTMIKEAILANPEATGPIIAKDVVQLLVDLKISDLEK